MLMRATVALAAGLLLAGCGRPVVFHTSDAYPQHLSEWQVVWRDGDALRLNDGVMVYDIATPLFTDYALKLRTVYVPPGEHATYDAMDAFAFPVGTVISKTFFYRRDAAGSDNLLRQADWNGEADTVNFRDYRILETRLLVRQADGWDALPYIWDGNDATLSVTGKVIRARLDGEPIPYLVPTRNECGSCHISDHTARQFLPIGLKARHLNHDRKGQNQLVAMRDRHWLQGLPDTNVPANPAMDDTGASLDARARAYLDANCGHCHNARGAADTSGLLLDASNTERRHMGLCKPPIAAGSGTGGRNFGIVPGQPDASMLLWRMTSTNPGTRMPELGRSLVHAEGVALIHDWIAQMPGEC
ncbi:MAG: SO2930 family diheme c-type cytochrome [Pseudomonadales bacterium]